MAAMQDHGLAIVLGDPSHGRSTVQTVIPLDRFSTVRLGDLKMTVAQPFRLDGGSFEGRSVTPGVVIAGAHDAGPPALRHGGFPVTAQAAVGIRKDEATTALLPSLVARHAARSANDARYRTLLEAQGLAWHGKDEVLLNEIERRRLRAAPPLADAGAVQLDEALKVVGDALELTRAAAGRAGR